MNRVLWKIVIVMLGVSLLSGCFQEKVENNMIGEGSAFNGLYDNKYNSDTLEFRQGMVYIHSAQQQWEHPFSVEGTTLRIEIRNNSKEKREDLLMTIHSGGEVLTCSACAMHSLSNHWEQVNTKAKTTQ